MNWADTQHRDLEGGWIVPEMCLGEAQGPGFSYAAAGESYSLEGETLEVIQFIFLILQMRKLAREV